MSSQATTRDVLRDQQFLFFSVVIGNKREQIGVLKPSYASHVFMEVFSFDLVHMLESLHHHRLPVHQHRLVGGAQVSGAQHFRRRSQQVLQIELCPIRSHERQLSHRRRRPRCFACSGAAVIIAWGAASHRPIRRRRCARSVGAAGDGAGTGVIVGRE